jgi:low temperature requirement protein LtrA
MTGRSTVEEHRVSSPLELLFDLTFVVAIARIAAELAADIAGGHAGDGVVPYLTVFFAIWWAWMNFTWFASAYDVDDVPYRLLTMVQMAGVLVLAAGVPAAFGDGDFITVTIGYFIMRVGLVAQWVRAAVEHRDGRPAAIRYAVGVSAVQALWLARLALPEQFGTSSFVALAVLELAVPVWAARRGESGWHPHHIAERYGLFTIIVLGEGVLAATIGVQQSLQSRGVSGDLVVVSLASLVLVFALWWLYFLEPAGDGLGAHRSRSYYWGYGHYGVFAALAALGAGLEVAVEETGHHLEVPAVEVAYAVAVPVAVFLVLLWALHAPLVSTLVISPAIILPAAAVVLVVPLAADAVGLPAVLCLVAAVCTAVVVATIAKVRRSGATLAPLDS